MMIARLNMMLVLFLLVAVTSMLRRKVVVVVKNQAPKEKHPRLHWMAKHSHLWQNLCL